MSHATYKQALESFVRNPNTQPIMGTYRGNIPVIHHYDPATTRSVMTAFDGDFLSGWRLGVDQIGNLFRIGNVQEGARNTDGTLFATLTKLPGKKHFY